LSLGIKDNEIVDFLRIARTIGGHMLWPRGKQPTVNQAKAGSGGFYDRIDWTLIVIETFYRIAITKKENEACFITECKKLLPLDVCNYNQFEAKFIKMFIALTTHKMWFEKFGTFGEFCEFYKLRGNFVDDQYSVIELAPLFPILPQNYEKYISNSIDAIKKRNDLFYLKLK